MNQLTTTVLAYQKETDVYKKDALFTDVYKGVQKAIAAKIQSYIFAIKGDTLEAESRAIESLMRLAESFHYEGNQFMTAYSRVLDNTLRDLVRHVNSKKHLTMANTNVSLDSLHGGEGEEDGFAAAEYLAAAGAMHVDEYMIEEELTLVKVIQTYAATKPFEAGVIDIMITYSSESKSVMTTAFAEYYGEVKYTANVQRRVSRVRANFARFATDMGYQLPF